MVAPLLRLVPVQAAVLGELPALAELGAHEDQLFARDEPT